MTVTALAVVPAAPVLLPELAAGAAGELAGLRAACDRAIAHLRDHADVLVVCAAADPGGAGARFTTGDLASFHGLGACLQVSLGGAGAAGGPEPAVLPLGLSVAAALLARSGWSGPTSGFTLAAGDDGLHVAEQIASLAGAVGVLVAADGSARRTPKAPGAYDPRAEAFDAGLAAALADPSRAAALDQPATAALADELWCRSWPAWRLLARLAAGVGSARLLADEAPYGVGYFAATWTAEAGERVPRAAAAPGPG